MKTHNCRLCRKDIPVTCPYNIDADTPAPSPSFTCVPCDVQRDLFITESYPLCGSHEDCKQCPQYAGCITAIVYVNSH